MRLNVYQRSRVGVGMNRSADGQDNALYKNIPLHLRHLLTSGLNCPTSVLAVLLKVLQIFRSIKNLVLEHAILRDVPKLAYSDHPPFFVIRTFYQVYLSSKS